MSDRTFFRGTDPQPSAARLLDPASRTADDLTTDQGDQTSHAIWSRMQRGLVYPSPYANFVTFWRNAPGTGVPLTKALLTELLKDLRHEIHQHWGNAHTTAVMGVGFQLWQEFCASEGQAPPAGMKLLFPVKKDGVASKYDSEVFTRPGSAFVASQADLWFHIKSDRDGDCAKVRDFLQKRLERDVPCVDPAKTISQDAATKATGEDKLGGKVVGCRFSENLNNPVDPISVQENTIVGFEDPDHLGASYVLAQRFYLNWSQILALNPEHIEDLVGRTTEDILIPSRHERSHIKCSRAQDQSGNTMQLLRLGLPFGQSRAVKNEELRAAGATLRDEEGIYFAGYAKSVGALESIMDRQIGGVEGFMTDNLLSHVKSNLGGFYYIPSRADMNLDPAEIKPAKELDWSRFPGVDWNRLDRHFRQTSANGYMHYNHKEYLFSMATMSGPDRERFRPPSTRVLKLLSNAFSRWQDNWYFDRAQEELEHLSVYVERKYGREKAEEVMSLPVAERMGWTIKVALGDVFASEAYGFRGRKQDANGNFTNGADTYRIEPVELIVGALPNLGLGQGKHLIDYAREDERLSNFFTGLSYASGVGHVVPGFQQALDVGLGGLLADLEARLAGAADEKKRSFYRASILALEGVRDNCLAYARLAGEMAAKLCPGQKAERENLLAIEARMKKLAVERPATFLEAVQLVFTLHACIHLIGEPTAIGRLDQLLYPFYERDRAEGRLEEDEAQEIIDCFWVKIGEKVQLNRQFVEDHQVFGNLAMGGSSGNYPKGSSNNQWIQQVTVGGTVADDAPGDGTPAYNAVTLLCLRAARRLPLNAPCLSLRVRKDIPAEYLEEAALAILSGGAHPILLSDEKIIAGLAESGDRVGQGSAPTKATPVKERAGGRFTSEVSRRDARDYACDGCFEPQLAGKNWFTLGGLTMPTVLEAALNQGKSWLTAGPVWFHGQRISFTSKPAKDIRTFEEVCDLFFEHMRWMYAKQVDGTLAAFGLASAVCPSPLLSVFVDGCIEKGLDFYEGGPRYNIIAPCFTGLSTAIDSLWAIRAMVFDPSTAVTSLPELVEALICNWGYDMVEPFFNTLEGTARREARAERFKRLRDVAMALPKYGRGSTTSSIDAFGDEILLRVAETAGKVFTDPAEATAQKMVDLALRLGTPEQPFGGFQITPGAGTFENYLDWGAGSGASADGRRLGDNLASDLSPSPSYDGQAINPREAPFKKVLAGYTGKGSSALWDGAPTDFNIREDFPVDALVKALRAFADEQGSNILTITCADPRTFEMAREDPEKFDLLRVRMGGWTEFFVAMFPAHQAQHQRRPLNTPDAD